MNDLKQLLLSALCFTFSGTTHSSIHLHVYWCPLAPYFSLNELFTHSLTPSISHLLNTSLNHYLSIIHSVPIPQSFTQLPSLNHSPSFTQTLNHSIIHSITIPQSHPPTHIQTVSFNYRASALVGRRTEIENGMSAESCARGIVQSIRDYEIDYLIGPFHHKLVVYMKTLCPKLYNYVMSRL